MLNSIKMTGVAVAATLCLFAHATDYYLSEDATDWSEKSSYTLEGGSTPEELPGPEDTVFLPQGKSCSFVGGSDSFNVFANVDWVRPHAQGGNTIEITVAGGTTNTLNCAIADSLADKNYALCVITKKGDGALRLAADRRHAEKSGAAWDYLSSFVIEAGDLICKPDPVRTPIWLGAVYVGVNGRLVLPPVVDKNNNNGLSVAALSGSGIVENVSTASDAAFSVRKAFGYLDFEKEPFSGKIAGDVYLYGARLDLTGTESTFTKWAMGVYDADETLANYQNYGLSVRKFGKVGEPSSLGVGDTIGTGYWGGRILYTGEGEECDKDVVFNVIYANNKGPSVMDAGAKGGVRFTGTSWTGTSTYSTGSLYFGWLVLTGSNTVPCVIDSPIKRWHHSSTLPYRSFHVTKRGTGTWELSGNAKNSTTEGSFTVEEGTLRYDSLAEVGENSSLGRASMLMEAKIGNEEDLEKIPFAMILGGPDTVGTLEYIGTEPFENKTRLIGLAGKAGVLSSTTADISFNGATSAEAGEHTLILAGDRATGYDTMCNITNNGIGVVSVVKTGTGSWLLDGEQSFTGDLIVSNGTLTVRAPDKPYNWFRVDLLSVWDENPKNDTTSPRLQELALYDANGVRQNKDLVYNRFYDEESFYSKPQETAANLPAGHVTPVYPDGKDIPKIGWGGTAPTDRDIVNLFDDQIPTKGNLAAGMFLTSLDEHGLGKGVYGTATARTLCLVMHLTNGTPAIAAYDFACGATKGDLKSWAVHGSVDGKHWTTLTNVVTDVKPNMTKSQWYSDPTKTFAKNQVRPGEGFPIAGAASDKTLTLAANVSVAPGATLKAEGTVVVSRLTLDPAGMGTLDGFTFAESGVLSAGGEQALGQPVELPYAFTNAKGVDNIEKWAVSVGGKVRRGWTIARKDDKFVLTPPGVMLIVR